MWWRRDRRRGFPRERGTEKKSVPYSFEIHSAKRAISPLKIGDKIEVIGMAPEQECAHEMFITIRWEKNRPAVPLAQLQPDAATDSVTITAAEDWRYWVERGYQF